MPLPAVIDPIVLLPTHSSRHLTPITLFFGEKFKHWAGVLHDLVGDAVRVIPSLQDDMDPILRALENPNRTPTAVQWDALTKGKGEHTWPAVAQEAHRAADDTFNYNAGIWALFHILSLSGFPASRVLSDMEGFAQNFFSCEYCRAHFLTMLDFKDNGLAQVELEGNAPADRATSLWVWRAHNAVTQHNSKEDGILEVHQHLWPSATECSACHHGVTDYGQPIWDEDRVFDYLRYTYGCTDRRASPEHLSSSAGIAGESGSMGGHGIVLWYPLTSLAILMVAIAAIKMKLSSTLASHPKKHGKSHVDPSTGEEGCPSSQVGDYAGLLTFMLLLLTNTSFLPLTAGCCKVSLFVLSIKWEKKNKFLSLYILCLSFLHSQPLKHTWVHRFPLFVQWLPPPWL